jgi:hypothetical protein
VVHFAAGGIVGLIVSAMSMRTISEKLPILVLSILALVCGIVVAFANFGLVIGLLGVATLALCILIWMKTGSKDGSVLAVSAIALAFVLPFIHKVAGVALFGLWQVLIVTVGIVGLRSFWSAHRRYGLFLSSILAFCLYIAWASISTLASERLNVAAYCYQLISLAKPWLLFSFCCFAFSRPLSELVFWCVIRWYWLVAVAFIIFEWLAPSLYFSLFDGAASRASKDLTGFLPSRAVGTFTHPSFLAVTASFFALLCFARSILLCDCVKYYRNLGFLYMAILFATVQRQEMIGFLLCMIVMLCVTNRGGVGLKQILGIIAVCFSAYGFWLVIGQDLLREASMWGLGTVGEISHPRAQIYDGAFHLAERYFPFGSGIGTYAGAGSVKFNLDLYYELGFAKFWWFLREDYLLDTYWPNSIAEGGWLGFFVFSLQYALLALYFLSRFMKSTKMVACYFLVAFLGVIFLMLNGLSSPAFQDPRLLLFVGVCFGLSGMGVKDAAKI